MKKILYLTLILSVGFISACKKDKKKTTGGGTTKKYAPLVLVQDSVYLYEKEDYLWNDAIPDYNTFKPRSYSGSTDLEALTNELDAITQLKINTATGLPYEYYPAAPGSAKYSFVDDGTTTASLGGTNGDFGFEPRYAADDDLRVKYVYPGSPADVAGLKRGYRITSINDNTDVAYSTNINFVINAIYYSQSIKMKITKPDGSIITVSFSAKQYTVNPVLTYKVLTDGAHKVGYIVFNSFTDLASNARTPLNTAFNYFITNNVTDIVVDLRYNGGGSGETAEYIDNLIAPAGKSGSVMYTSYFNSNLQSDNCPLLKASLESQGYNVPAGSFLPENNRVTFNKQLSLNVTKVCFLVTGSTASSSELTINNLRPVFNDLQIIGDTTYGKPVGEITIPIDKYVLFSPQEYVRNSANQGDYYTGMAPGTATYPGKLDNEDVTKDFGDPTETLLADALNYIKNGSYVITGVKALSLSNSRPLSLYQSRVMARKLDMHRFKPMILKQRPGKILK